MIEVVTTLDKLCAEKKQWQANEVNPALRIFQTFLWVTTAWEKILSKDASNKLWVLKWSQDGRDDVVFFPFYIDGKGTLRFILDDHNDNNDAVCSEAKLNRHFVYKEVVEAIQNEPMIRSVHLKKMRGDSEALNFLSVFLPGVALSKDNAFAYVKVDEAGDFSASQKHWKSENRKHFRKLLKQASGNDYQLLRASEGVSFPKDEILSLRDQMIESGDRAFGFVTNEMIELVESLYNAECCEIPVFRRDGKIISLEFRLLKGDYSLDWIYLTTDPRTGTEINVKYCDERAKTLAGVIDFGVGAYEYKILTTRPMVGVTYSLRYGKTFGSHLKLMLAAGIRMLKDAIKARRK